MSPVFRRELGDPLPCAWCGDVHGPNCPIVKAIEFDPATGVVTRVEFLTVADFPQREVKAPEEPQPDYPRMAATPGR